MKNLFLGNLTTTLTPKEVVNKFNVVPYNDSTIPYDDIVNDIVDMLLEHKDKNDMDCVKEYSNRVYNQILAFSTFESLSMTKIEFYHKVIIKIMEKQGWNLNE